MRTGQDRTGQDRTGQDRTERSVAYLARRKHSLKGAYMSGEDEGIYNPFPVLFLFKDGSEIFNALRRRFLRYLPFDLFPFGETKWLTDLKHCDAVVISLGLDFKSIVKKIQRKYPKMRIFYWISDVQVFRRKIEFIDWLEKQEIECLCFDKALCEEFNLVYTRNFISQKTLELIPKIKESVDAIFIGDDKDRAEMLLLLQKEFLANGKVFKIIMPKNNNRNSKYSGITYIDGWLDYEAYISEIKSSKVMVDIVQKIQSGNTLRPLEAMFLGKKIITNNHLIKNEDYYSPENIFVLGKDDIKDLLAFISTPFQQLSPEILSKYDIHGWLTEVGNLV
ncbi:MAG: hypothetical protein LKF42_03825 [Streptococcaceae bacterium]|nr:hypothetical protein [Streptococcaceae bacterium]MCH4176953.1 hypothetical protein [Streptococcaceae bacterium]